MCRLTLATKRRVPKLKCAGFGRWTRQLIEDVKRSWVPEAVGLCARCKTAPQVLGKKQGVLDLRVPFPWNAFVRTA